MRIYYVYLPDQPVQRMTNIRQLKNLPEGTHIECDAEYDSWPIPVKDGKPDFKLGTAKHRGRLIK